MLKEKYINLRKLLMNKIILSATKVSIDIEEKKRDQALENADYQLIKKYSLCNLNLKNTLPNSNYNLIKRKRG